jgi:hypothetical protein
LGRGLLLPSSREINVATREYVLHQTREKIAEVYNLLPDASDLDQVTPDDVRAVVVILGASRSGSSYLFSTLAATGGFWSPQGEDTPHLRLANLGWVDDHDQSDAWVQEPDGAQLHSAAMRLLLDIGRPGKPQAANLYAAQSATRLLMQWPLFDLHPQDVLHSFQHWQESSSDPVTLWRNWLESSGLDLGYYDGFQRPMASPPEFLLEEPPFILQMPRQIPTPVDLRKGVLLLKTSSHAYRLPFLRGLFPQAKFKWLVLTRNPASSINGLIDGWLSNAFQSHRVSDLQIKGYDHHDWWKFDLPPGWSDYATADLPNVCAFQWSSAYEHIARFIEATPDPVLRIKHEDLIDNEKRTQCLAEIMNFSETLGKPPPARPPVMATQFPEAARWRKREREILPVLKRLETLAAKFHYDVTRPEAFL